jgi:hypothetical protein
MIRLLIPFLIFGTAVSAMDGTLDFVQPPPSPYLYDRVEIYEDPKPTDGWFARAVINNVRGSYNAVEVDTTSKGDVGIKYTTTTPSKVNDIDSADEACVEFLPEGVVAIPQCVLIMEEEKETIFLYEYLGG